MEPIEGEMTDEQPEMQDTISALGLDRRQFLFRAAGLGLAATALPAFLVACQQLDATQEVQTTALGTTNVYPTATPFDASSVTPLPQSSTGIIPGASPTPSANIAATATPTPIPTATPVSKPKPTATPVPTATPTPVPTATPTPTPVPTATPTPVPPPQNVFRPTPKLDTEEKKIRHLAWRAGFGATRAELKKYNKLGLQGTIDHFLNYENRDNGALEERLSKQTFNLNDSLSHKQRWWLMNMAYSSRPLQEKMTLFWHGILTSSDKITGDGPQTIQQNNLFRDNAIGRYDQLLKAVSRDPAMMIYLDSRSNKKKAPNENYSRELMELFTLGLDQYTEEDVRESARSFTGWELKKKTLFRFNSKQHDYGQKTFLGQTGDFDGDDVVDIIMQQPVAAEYISKRLWQYFAYESPEPEVISRLAEIFRKNNTNIKPVLRAIFESPEFYGDKAVGALVKSPAEYVAGIVRVLEIETNFQTLNGDVTSMGQELFHPPDVAGWDGGTSWLNSQTLMARINTANEIVTTKNKSRINFNPLSLLDNPQIQAGGAIVGSFDELLFGGRMQEKERRFYVSLFENLASATKFPNQKRSLEEKIKTLVYLMISSPDFQLS
tara:strand:+ start:112 stop:1935 length:1824 start_codon:yes stop_codon:yes gene_type:complete